MKRTLHILFISSLFASCQSTPTEAISARIIATEDYQSQIKLDKKKQAELDLPFRGFSYNNKAITSIAFGSPETNSWSTIENNNPELMILTSAPAHELKKHPEYRSIREKVPFMCSPHTDDAVKYLYEWPYAKRIIPENQNGHYHSRIFGEKKNELHVILMDDSKTDKKWSWLENELKKSTQFKILSYAITEKNKVLELIKKNKISNLILLPNDHRVSRIEKVNGFKSIFEGISTERTPANDNLADTFGLIQIDWKNRKALIEILSAENSKNQVIDFKF